MTVDRGMVDRFWSKVDRRGAEECWPWTACTNQFGRGSFRVGRIWCSAPRAAWLITHGNWPEGHVCHSCDNPSCVNPSHLWVGSHADNMRDRNRKGRQARGGRNHNAKLTEADVAAIRADHRSSRALAKIYGVSAPTIQEILRGETWAWLVSEAPEGAA